MAGEAQPPGRPRGRRGPPRPGAGGGAGAEGPTDVAVRGDGRVRKVEVLRAGRGAGPGLHAACLCHYSAAPAGGGPPFLSTRAGPAPGGGAEGGGEPVRLTAGRRGGHEEGLCAGLEEMLPGERCRLWVGWELAYGERGRTGGPSRPAVPPRQDVVYDIELLSWEPPRELPRSEMLFEERCEAAERRRRAGNALFRDGDLPGALAEYRAALDFVDEELMLQLHGAHVDVANSVRLPALLNSAAVHSGLEDWQGALDCAKRVLAEDPSNAKAFFRQGVAQAAQGRLTAALDSLRRADELRPGDASVRRELRRVTLAKKSERATGDALYRGMFNGGEQGARGETGRRGADASPAPSSLIGQAFGPLFALIATLLRAIMHACERLLPRGTAPARKKND